MPVTITTKDIRLATQLLCDHLEKNGHGSIHVTGSLYYWSIPKEQEWNPDAYPTECSLGDIGDDVDYVRRIVSGDIEPVGHACVWLASLLRCMGQSVSC